MTTITTRSGKGSPLTNNEVDANFTNLNDDKVEASGDSMTGNLSFGDNNKAIFGAGSDLQIYHNGSNSYIDDAGTGSLVIRSSQVNIGKYTGETAAVFTADGSVQLRYDNSAKFETTNTGIDVTGTATVDGLDVANVKIESDLTTTPTNDGANYIFRAASGHADYNGGDLIIQARSSASRDIYMLTGTTTPVNRFKVDGGGDISFYEDTGTTAKLFWDASAESLGIGTTSPASPLTINGTDPLITFENGESPHWQVGFENTQSDRFVFYDNNASAYRMVIDSSGNVGLSHTDFTNYSGKLVVADGSVGGSSFIDIHNNNNNQFVKIGINNNTALIAYDNADEIAFGQMADASGTSLATEHMRIDSSGNVGIGTSSPEADLHIAKSASSSAGGAKLLLKPASAYGSIVNNDDLGQIAFGAKTSSIDNTNNDSVMIRGVADATWAASDYPTRLEFWTTTDGTASPSERMRIDSSGNVGIGTSSPAFAAGAGLEIEQAGTATLRLQDTTNTANGEIRSGPSGIEFFSGAYGTSGNPFSFSVSGTTALTIDSDRDVGIGNTSPARKLSVNSGGTQIAAVFQSTSTNSGRIALMDANTTADNYVNVAASGNALAFYAGAAECARITSGGNFGIGTTSPATALHINSGTTNEAARFESTDTEVALELKDTTGTAKIKSRADFRFETGATPSEAMRIDASGNLLVGTTTTTAGNEGMVYFNGSSLRVTRDSDEPLNLDRLTTNGSLVDFKKDGTTVGSIGTNNDGGSKLFIGSAESAIKFKTNTVAPATETGANNNNDIDLGENGNAFKNLYLSGGVYVGGTGSANLLDDYEEGTWTPTFEGTTSGSKNLGAIGRYTKTGRIVHITFNASNVDFSSAAITGTVELSGLPFNIASNGHGLGNIAINNFITGGSDYVPYTYATDILRFSAGNTSQLSDSGLTQSTTRNIAISLTYEAA